MARTLDYKRVASIGGVLLVLTLVLLAQVVTSVHDVAFQAPPAFPAQNAGQAGVHTSAAITCDLILNNSTIDADVSSTYAVLLSNVTFSNVSTWPVQSLVESRIYTMFQTVCAIAGFQSLIQNWTVSNFSLELGRAAWTSGGLTWANFTVGWQQWFLPPGTPILKEHVEYWSGDLASTTVTGPFTMTPQESMTMGMGYQRATIPSWSGWEWYVPSSGGSKQNLLEGFAWDNPPTMSDPRCCQVGGTIDSIGAGWTGLSGLAFGGGGLLQTGWVIDETSPTANYCMSGAGPSCHSCDYSLWWEFAPSYPAYPYSGGGYAAPGTINWLAEYALGHGYWNAAYWQWPSGAMSTHFIYLGGWEPKYGQEIVESPALSHFAHHISQITASWGMSNPVRWEFGGLYTASACVPLSGLYAASDGTIYWMSQKSGVDNTNQNFASGGQYWGSTGSWPQSSWDTSDYDYNYV